MAPDTLKLEQFADALLRVVPELKPALDDHLREYDQLLLHVFLGDVTRFAIATYRDAKNKAGASDDRILRSLLKILEAAMSSPDDRLQELISVSFLENLQQAGPDYEGIKKLLGPRLALELRAIEIGSAGSGSIH